MLQTCPSLTKLLPIYHKTTKKLWVYRQISFLLFSTLPNVQWALHTALFFGLASGHGSHLHTLIVLTKKGESVEVCLHRICSASGTLYIQTTFRTTCCPQFYLRRTASVKRLRLARCSLLSFFSSNLKHQSSIYQTLTSTLLWNASTIRLIHYFHKKCW